MHKSSRGGTSFDALLAATKEQAAESPVRHQALRRKDDCVIAPLAASQRPATGRLPPPSSDKAATRLRPVASARGGAPQRKKEISLPYSSTSPAQNDKSPQLHPKGVASSTLPSVSDELPTSHQQQPPITSRWSAHRPSQQHLYHFQDHVMPVLEEDRAVTPLVQWNKRTDDPTSSSSGEERNMRSSNRQSEKANFNHVATREALRGDILQLFLTNNYRFAQMHWEKIAHENFLPSREENFRTTLAEAAEKIRQAIADTYRSSSSSSSDDSLSRSPTPPNGNAVPQLLVDACEGNRNVVSPSSGMTKNRFEASGFTNDLELSASTLENSDNRISTALQQQQQQQQQQITKKRKKRRVTVPAVDPILAGASASVNIADRESNLQDILDLVESVSREHALNTEDEFASSPASSPTGTRLLQSDDDSDENGDLFGAKRMQTFNAASAFSKRRSTVNGRNLSRVSSVGGMGLSNNNAENSTRRVVQRVTSPVSLLTEDDLERIAAEERMKEIEVSSLQHLKDVYDSMALAKKHKLQYKSHIPPAGASAKKSPAPEAVPEVPSPTSVERALLFERQQLLAEETKLSPTPQTQAPKEKKRLNFGNKGEKSSDTEKAEKGPAIPGKMLETSMLDEGLSLSVHGVRRGGGAVGSDADSATQVSELDSAPSSPQLLSFDYLTVWLVNTTEHDAFTVHTANEDSLGFDMLPVKSKADGDGCLAVVLPGGKVEAARLIPAIPVRPNASYSLKCSVLKKEEYVAPPPPPSLPLSLDGKAQGTAHTSLLSRKSQQRDTAGAPITVTKVDPERSQHEKEVRAAQLSKAMKLYKDLQVLQDSKQEEEPKRDPTTLRRPTIAKTTELPKRRGGEEKMKTTPLVSSSNLTTEILSAKKSEREQPTPVDNEHGGHIPPPPQASAGETKKKKRNSKLGVEKGSVPRDDQLRSGQASRGTEQDGPFSSHDSQVIHNVVSVVSQPVVESDGLEPSEHPAEAPFKPLPTDPQDGDPQQPSESLPRIRSSNKANTLRSRHNTAPSHEFFSGGNGGGGGKAKSSRLRDQQEAHNPGSSKLKTRGRRASYATMEKRHSEVFRENKLYEELYVRDDGPKKEASRPRYVRPKSNSVFDVSTFVRNRHAAEPPVEDDVAKMIRSLRSRPQAPSSATRGLTFTTPLDKQQSTATASSGAPTSRPPEEEEQLSASLRSFARNKQLVTADVLLENLSTGTSQRNRSVSFVGGGDDQDEDDYDDHGTGNGEPDRVEGGEAGSGTDSDNRSKRSKVKRSNPTSPIDQSSLPSTSAPTGATASGGKVRRVARPNQIRTLSSNETASGKPSPKTSRSTLLAGATPAGEHATPRVSFMESDENNAVLDAVLGPMGRSLLSDPSSAGNEKASSAPVGRDFVDRLVDEAAASGATHLLGRIKSASSVTSAGGSRQRAHTVSGSLSPRTPSGIDSLDPRRATITSIASKMAAVSVAPDASDLSALGVKVDDSYRVSRRTSRQTNAESAGSTTPPCDDTDEDPVNVQDQQEGRKVEIDHDESEAVLNEGEARELFNEQPERFVEVGNDVVKSIASKIVEHMEKNNDDDDENDGKEHPSHDIKSYSVPRQNTAIHPDELKRRLAADAEAARLYEEQERLAHIMKSLVMQVKEIWRREQEETTEQKSTQAFFKLSMDVAWRMQQRRNINLSKLLNLLERKCGERNGSVRNWMPYYRDDNVFVENDDDDDVVGAGQGEGGEVAIGTGSHTAGRIVAQGFHPTTRAAAAVMAEDHLYRQRNGVALDCEEEIIQHVQRLLPPGRLEELVPTYEPEQIPIGSCLRPSKPLVPRTSHYAKICVLQLGDVASSSSGQQQQGGHGLKATLSGRALARERLRALRRRRVMRYVLMDGTEVEAFTRFPSWQTRYS